MIAKTAWILGVWHNPNISTLHDWSEKPRRKPLDGWDLLLSECHSSDAPTRAEDTGNQSPKGACTDPKDARIRGRDGPYQYASEPISVVESDRLSNAWTKR